MNIKLSQIYKVLMIITLIFVLCFTMNVSVRSSVNYNNTSTEEIDEVVFNQSKVETTYNGRSLESDLFTYSFKPNDYLKIATWSYASTHGYTLNNLMAIAENYEKNHPGWVVIGGVNAEGFSGSYNEITNAFIQDGEVIRKDISNESFKELIGFYEDGSHVVKRVPKTSEKPYLTNINKNIQYEVNSIDSLGDIAVITPDLKQSIDTTDYFVYYCSYSIYRRTHEFPNYTLNGPNLGIYLKGKVIKQLDTSTIDQCSNSRFFILSKEELNLEENDEIRIQYEFLEDFQDVVSMTGYMFKLVENGNVIDNTYYQDWSSLYEEGIIPSDDSFYYKDHSYLTGSKERTGIGFKKDGTIVLCATCAGSFGMTTYELADVMGDLGCNEAYQFDSGGSVSFIKRNENGGFDFLNTPGDGKPRSLSTGLFIVKREASIDTSSSMNSLTFSFNQEKMENLGISNVQLHINNNTYDLEEEVEITNLKENTNYQYYVSYNWQNQVINSLTYNIKTKSYDVPYLIFNQLFIDEDRISFGILNIDDLKNCEIVSLKGVIDGTVYEAKDLVLDINDLEKDTTYNIDFIYEIKDLSTGNIYQAKTEGYEFTTLDYKVPSINSFDASINNNELIITFNVEDSDNVGTIYYILDGQEILILNDQNMIKTSIDLSINHTVSLMIKYPNGKVMSDDINLDAIKKSGCSMGNVVLSLMIFTSIAGSIILMKGRER